MKRKKNFEYREEGHTWETIILCAWLVVVFGILYLDFRSLGSEIVEKTKEAKPKVEIDTTKVEAQFEDIWEKALWVIDEDL